MKITIIREFDGYPNGDDKAPVTFMPSDKPVDVADEFGTMIVAKGLAQAAAGPVGQAPHED